MVEHQRSVLAVLGIDVWIPKADVQTRAYTNSLYRDQAAPEHHLFQGFDVLDAVALGTDQDNPQDEALVELRAVQIERVQIKPDQAQKIQAAPIQPNSEDRPSFKIDAFELQALNLEHCVLVTDVTQMSMEQASLWRNIQLAVQGQITALKWPFALELMQDGRGAKIYVQGFLDAMCIEKKLIGLGEIPHCQHSAILEMPSLQAMLDQPILKRTLWQMMQK